MADPGATKNPGNTMRTIRVVIHRRGRAPRPIDVTVPTKAGPCPETIHPGGVAYVRIDDVIEHEPGAIPHHAPLRRTPTPSSDGTR